MKTGREIIKLGIIKILCSALALDMFILCPIAFAAPAAPSNLSASPASDSQINLLWTDNSSDEDGFVIERREGQAFAEIGRTLADDNTYSDLTANGWPDTNQYRVRAYNDDSGDSDYSNEAEAVALEDPYWISISANDASGLPGDEVLLTISISEDVVGTRPFDLWNIEFLLTYDKDMLELPAFDVSIPMSQRKVKTGSLTDGWLMGWVIDAPEIPTSREGVKIGITGAGMLMNPFPLDPEESSIAKIYFKVKDGAQPVNLPIHLTMLFSGDAVNPSLSAINTGTDICNFEITEPITTYTLTVTSGSGNGNYAAGTPVTITANNPPAGQRFKEWTGSASDVGLLADAAASSTGLTMPARNVSLTATYEDIPIVTYTLTVTSGSGSGNYKAGTTVIITADSPQDGAHFKQWMAPNPADLALISVNSPMTILVMPARPVTLIASYGSSAPGWTVADYGNYMHFFPIYGTVRMNGAPLGEDAWVGVFDTAGNCYGIGEYRYNNYAEKYTYALSAYPNVPDDGIAGFNSGDTLYFRLFIPGMDSNGVELISYNPDPPYGPLPYYYPYDDVMTDKKDPVGIYLTTPDTMTIELEKGWNLISLNIRPSSPVTEDVFSSILDDYLLHVHQLGVEYWDRSIWLDPSIEGGGLLRSINAEESYYVDVSDECSLTVTGLYMPTPFEFKLESGWNSISYLYLNDRKAFEESNGGGVGLLDDIVNDVIWAKVGGPGLDWVMPNRSGAEGHNKTLSSGNGIFIKIKEGLTEPISLWLDEEETVQGND